MCHKWNKFPFNPSLFPIQTKHKTVSFYFGNFLCACKCVGCGPHFLFSISTVDTQKMNNKQFVRMTGFLWNLYEWNEFMKPVHVKEEWFFIHINGSFKTDDFLRITLAHGIPYPMAPNLQIWNPNPKPRYNFPRWSQRYKSDWTIDDWTIINLIIDWWLNSGINYQYT